MDIILFANFFPYKRSEPFLVNELEFTRKYASSICVFTLYGDEKDALYKDLYRFKPLLRSAHKQSELLVKGLFNRGGIEFHLREFFSKKLFLHPQKAYWFFVSFLITRIAVSSRAFTELLTKIETLPRPVLYFYWSDNLFWIMPYLLKKVKRNDLKVVVRFHGSDLYEHLKGDYAPLREIGLRAATWLCPVSGFGLTYMKKKYPAFEQKMVLSRLGVADHGINPFHSAGKHHIVSVSNVVALKRLHIIYQALEGCKEKMAWHHFGDGPLLEELKELAESHRPGIEIIFHGHVENNALMEFYQKTPVSLFMNVSSTEGLPVSIMEALSFGIPVVATDVGGVGDLVDDTVGKLVNASIDIKSLAAVIEKILNLPAPEMETMRSCARDVFFEKVNAAENYRRFYDMLKHPAPPGKA